MKSLRVTNIQRGCVYDGPGVRTTIFLKGCSLKCPWCCNPECISYEKQWYVDNTKCLLTKGVNSVLCDSCERVGGIRTINNCPFEVTRCVSNDYEAAELFDIIKEDIDLFKKTNGGVTFSGGEPLLQSELLLPILKLLQDADINIAFETTLFVPNNKLEIVLKYVDFFYVDLKLQPQMMLYNKVYHNLIMHNIKGLKNKNVVYRMVFVDDVLEKSHEIINDLRKMEVYNIELLLCHNMGLKKYEKLSLTYQTFSSDLNKAEEFCKTAETCNIKVRLLSV